MCAKVTGPLFSLSASGSVGKTLVFSKWIGRDYVRQLVIPANPQSDNQALARTALGSLGRALGFVRFPNALNEFSSSQFYLDAAAGKPADQSWISWAIRTLLGTSLATYEANRAAYDGLSSGVKTQYTVGATALGLTDFDIGYGDGSAITKGEQLYHMAWFASVHLNFVFDGTLNAPSETDPDDIADLVSYIQDIAS